MLREAARSSHERSGAKFRAKSTAFGNRYARKNLKKLAGRDPRTPGFSSECAMTCKRLKWWAGTGLNRRHQDFQSCPIPLTALPDPAPSVENRTFTRSARRPTTASRQMTTGDSVRVRSESGTRVTEPSLRGEPLSQKPCNGMPGPPAGTSASWAAASSSRHAAPCRRSGLDCRGCS